MVTHREVLPWSYHSAGRDLSGNHRNRQLAEHWLQCTPFGSLGYRSN